MRAPRILRRSALRRRFRDVGLDRMTLSFMLLEHRHGLPEAWNQRVAKIWGRMATRKVHAASCPAAARASTAFSTQARFTRT
jgi:hypothetical protein